jgi:hypothetical protein
MKIRVLFLATLFCNILFSQNYITVGSNKYFLGCKIDKKEFSKIPEVKYPKTRLFETLAQSFSLSEYLPKAGDQGYTGTCVSWATTYYTLSILYNIQNTTKIEFSPYFSYNNLKMENDSACQDGLYISRALEFLKYKGGIPSSKYLSQCKLNKDTANENWDEAINYRIKDFKSIGEENRIQRIKKSLSLLRPIVIGIRTPYSFAASLNGDTWDGIVDEIRGGHALSLIGYDDKKEGGSFEIMNSWGQEWGDEGKIWIKYSDFDKIVDEVYEISGFTKKEITRYKTRNNFEGEIKIIDRQGKSIEQDIISNDFLFDNEYNTILPTNDTILNIIDSNENIEPFSDLLLSRDNLNQFYSNNFEPKILEYNFEYIDPDFFEKEFKIKITNKDSGYIYLFAFDGRSETFIPIGTNNYSKIFLNKNKSDIILPETDFFKNYISKHYVLLISKEDLNDEYIEQICSKKYHSIKEFLNFNFGINLVLKSPEKINNYFKLYNEPGKILPIIVNLKNISN